MTPRRQKLVALLAGIAVGAAGCCARVQLRTPSGWELTVDPKIEHELERMTPAERGDIVRRGITTPGPSTPADAGKD